MEVQKTHIILEVGEDMGQPYKTIKKVYELQEGLYVMEKTHKPNCFEIIEEETFKILQRNMVMQYGTHKEIVKYLGDNLLDEIKKSKITVVKYQKYEEAACLRDLERQVLYAIEDQTISEDFINTIMIKVKAIVAKCKK